MGRKNAGKRRVVVRSGGYSVSIRIFLILLVGIGIIPLALFVASLLKMLFLV